MSKKQYNRPHERKVAVLQAILVVVLMISVVGTGLFAIKQWERSRFDDSTAIEDEDEPLTVNYDGQWYRLNDRLETVLVMGLDKFTEQISTEQALTNHQQADFLLLMILDKEKKTCTPLHINRDTMAEIHRLGLNGESTGSFFGQLALAHTYGSGQKDSCRNTVKAVSDFLYEVPVNYYISLTMDAVGVLNDLVGGVTVTVMDDFSGIDDSLVYGQEVTLKGAQALTYVRARSGLQDSTNIHRMERQRQYLQALFEQCAAKVRSDDLFLVDAMVAIGDAMVTDCTDTKLQDFFEKLSDYQIASIQTIQGESVLGEQFMEFYADEAALKKQVIDLFFLPDQKH